MKRQSDKSSGSQGFLRIDPLDDAWNSHPPPEHPHLLKHEFTLMLTAPKGSGKTTVLGNLLIKHYKGYFHRVLVFSPTVDNDAKWTTIRNTRGVVKPNHRLVNWWESHKDKRESAKKAKKQEQEAAQQRKLTETMQKTNTGKVLHRAVQVQDVLGVRPSGSVKPSTMSGKGSKSVSQQRHQLGDWRKSTKDRNVPNPEASKEGVAKTGEEEEIDWDAAEEYMKQASKSDGKIRDNWVYTHYDEQDLTKVLRGYQSMLRAVTQDGKDKYWMDRVLFVFDDLVGSTLFSLSHKANPFKELNVRHRHYNASLILVTQAYKEVPKTMRTNASAHILFEIPSESELESIYEENPVCLRKDEWIQVYKAATSEPYSFLFINYQQPRAHQMGKNFELLYELGDREVTAGQGVSIVSNNSNHPKPSPKKNLSVY